MSDNESTHNKETGPKNRAAEIANTFEWLITAFILAFVFRAFVMEAFRIPTGSMADTLKGAHFRLRCPECGYRYDTGYVPQEFRRQQDTIPAGPEFHPSTRCPSCGYYAPRRKVPVSNGDRILVLKCIYQFFEPKRWDVTVFKNPLEPKINYIKRLVALPGETIEIIDGDIYIDGQIARKPPKVQEELWMIVYDNDYRPIRPNDPKFNEHKGAVWVQPFDFGDSDWKIDEKKPTLFELDSAPGRTHTMVYDTKRGNNFKATYAYNNIMYYGNRPYCSDLMVRLYVNFADSKGAVGISLGKNGIQYRAMVFPDARVQILKITRDGEDLLKETSIKSAPGGKPTLVKFANVDHQLILEVGREKFTVELGRSREDAGSHKAAVEPKVAILGSGKLALSHVAIFRDTYYTGKSVNGERGARASEGTPFTLEEDQFFMMGDNSPNSQDSRWWGQEGIGNNGTTYRAGIVPRDYLVGKALFVYWPSGFRISPAKSRFAVIPNIGQMRLIYGGSNKNP